ncbi:MAG TPA: sugar phosphate isomerase/epimerase, partial [Armatimonadetes bacterium]|nr:sugar phosphate isomerase/epimerase [Armatimonadota bacterium]
MFKLAFINDEASQEMDVAVRIANEFNLDGIELRSVWEKGPHELTDDEVERIKRMLDDAGLQCCCIASPFFKCDYGDEDQYREHLGILRRCVEVAHKLGTNMIRAFTFWRKEGVEGRWELIAEKYQEPIRIAEREGIILCVENEPSTNATNGAKLADFLRLIDHPSVRAVWDPGNDVFDPEREVPYPDGYECVKSFIVHVHLKDGVWVADENRFEAVPLGKGDVDFVGQFKALKRDGYEGWLSLETHYRPKVALPEDIVQMPKGSQFSYMGDVATRECLQNLFQLL